MKERFFRNRTAVFTVVFVLLVGLVGILAPVIAPNDPYETNILNKFASYSLQYPLGTDQLGRCVLSRMIYGIRPTLGLALLTMFGTISLGAILGIMAGYFRGIVEEVIMRVVDVMLSFPSQIMVFAVVALLGVSVQNVIIANVFIKWAWYARMIRTGVMQYRDRNFVRFSRCVGMPERFILFRHLLPSITSDLVVLASLDVGWAIINISTLSFLGLGVQAPTPEWGAMLNEAKNVMTSNPDDRSRYRHCGAGLCVQPDGRRPARCAGPQGGAEMNPVFELNDLHVSLQSHHKEIELVRGVSFAVAPGECLGILGESGSGKSMSMKAAMGLLDHSFHVKGSAQFQEELLGKSAEELRRLRGGKVGIILQNPMTCFDPLYRIGQQIAETFSAHNNWTAEEIHIRSLELLEKMRIRNPEEVLEKYPHQLSGGMLQRIMIGIATAMKPALLIADEPTTAIDAITQYEILNELLHIKENHNTAIIFISHDLNAISRVADRIVVLNHGAVVDRGDFQHILHHAQDPYTKLLVEKRADVMRRYTAVLNGKKETAHA